MSGRYHILIDTSNTYTNFNLLNALINVKAIILREVIFTGLSSDLIALLSFNFSNTVSVASNLGIYDLFPVILDTNSSGVAYSIYNADYYLFKSDVTIPRLSNMFVNILNSTNGALTFTKAVLRLECIIE